jgi:ferredoxin-type protein NapH
VPCAAILWFRAGEKAFATSLLLLGLSLGPCLGVYALVPTARKQTARRVVLLTGGFSIMAFSVLGKANLDFEGFFMLLFLGTAGAAIGHTLITVIIGPLFFGRLLCGWGCWRAMILELLPVQHSSGRRDGRWNLLPYLGLALSIGAAVVSVFSLRHHPGGTPGAMHSGSLPAILIGFAVYYTASIGMAFALRDQRAFCKYLCPGGVILGFTSRLSILKMTSDNQLCNACGACSKVCPMDIDVAHFAVLGQRVRSGQCILCQRCAHACPTGALRLTAAFDVAGATPFVLHPNGSCGSANR